MPAAQRQYIQDKVAGELIAQIGRETSSLLASMNSDQKNGFYVALAKQDKALAPGLAGKAGQAALGWGIGKIPIVGPALNFLIAHIHSDAQTAHDNTMTQIQTSIGIQ